MTNEVISLAALAEEKAFLDRVYATYTVDHSSQTKTIRELVARTVIPYLSDPGIGLELGCSDGYLTSILASKLSRLDVVDGSISFLNEAKKRALKNVSYIYSLFEEFESTVKYDYVFASFIQEHVLDPQLVLKMALRVMKPNGRLFVIVPNARALSRQLAMHMGIVKDLKDLTANDLANGHRRVYDRVYLNRELRESGFEIVAEGGLMLKILADFQMDKLIDDGLIGAQQIEGLYRLGLEYPDLCGALFAVCAPKAALNKVD
jgi:2-polyprenyl-3-methyl-5-hydroxy-6-metoxy-1,4-benzoquinol methylase